MSNHHVAFLPEPQQLELDLLLGEVPALVEDLAAAIAHGRFQYIDYQPKVSLGDRPAPMPYNAAAQDAADRLGGELGTWVRLVCEHRGVEEPHYGGPSKDSHWLRRNMVSLAHTPGADEALGAIRQVVHNARQTTGRHQEDTPHVDPVLLHRARREQLNARALSVLARQLGPQYADLTAKRVHNMRTAGHITPIREAIIGPRRTIAIYHVGTVMDAHLAHTTHTRTHTA